TAGQSRHLDPEGLDQPRQVGGRRLPLEVRVGREDQLVDLAVGEPGHQLADPQVIRPDAVDRADRPAENVVAAAELPGPFDRDDVLRFLDHADYLVVPPRVTADQALVLGGDAPADTAEMNLLL